MAKYFAERRGDVDGMPARRGGGGGGIKGIVYTGFTESGDEI